MGGGRELIKNTLSNQGEGGVSKILIKQVISVFFGGRGGLSKKHFGSPRGGEGGGGFMAHNQIYETRMYHEIE